MRFVELGTDALGRAGCGEPHPANATQPAANTAIHRIEFAISGTARTSS
jgi:hypothetical protein